MNRPKLVIRKNFFDHGIEILTCIALLISFAFPIYYYQDLPEQIPMHFNASGTADRIGTRNSIWILPILEALLCLGIRRLIRFPHLFNYPGKINLKNAEIHYRMAQRSLRMINLIIAGSFAYITLEIIFSSLGRSKGLGGEFLIIFSVLILGTPLFFLLKMWRMKNKLK